MSIFSGRCVQQYWTFLIIAWSIHNLEEALTMPHWIEQHKNILPLTSFITIQTIQQSFPIALILATILPILIGIFSIIKKWDTRIFAIILGIFLVNALQHIALTIIFKQYTPGCITAFLINLPLAVFILKYLFNKSLLKNFSWYHIIILGTIAFVISILLIWIISFSINRILN
ncbi:MAG: HXXEE domain-containing protein [Chitinophagaceae bacterium]